jgi:hypothetical protein
MQCVELVPNGSENVTNLFQLAKKVTNLFQIANKSDELIPNGSVEPVPIDKSCRLYSIWHTFELIPNGRVGLVQPPRCTNVQTRVKTKIFTVKLLKSF